MLRTVGFLGLWFVVLGVTASDAADVAPVRKHTPLWKIFQTVLDEPDKLKEPIFLDTKAETKTFQKLPKPLKIVTFNIANYDDHKDWDERVKLIAQALNTADADVVSLQEVRFNVQEASTRKSFLNQGEEILKALNDIGAYHGAHLVTQPTMYYPIGSGTSQSDEVPGYHNGKTVEWEGSSIISKRPILETGDIFLTKSMGCSDGNRRATQYVAIDMTDGDSLLEVDQAEHDSRLYVFNTHFGLEGQCLEDNIMETLNYINRFNKSACLLMGDMNAEPDDQLLQKLHTHGGLIDLWEKTNKGDAGLTFPAKKPIKRIDYMWANPEVLPRAESMSIFAKGTSEVSEHASDHLGLELILI